MSNQGWYFFNRIHMNIPEVRISYSHRNPEPKRVSSSWESYCILKKTWNQDTIDIQEECKVMLLNRANSLLGIYPLSKGGVSGTLVDPKLVFCVALKCKASNIILAHNHPSGNLKPSEMDKHLTKKLILAGKSVGHSRF